MAGFRTHITTSCVLGVGYGATAYTMFDVPLASSMLATGLCGVSGMLPDLDSGSGVPLRESMAFAAAVVPMMMIDRFATMGMTVESMVLASGIIYLLIRFGLAAALRKYTVHRGMFHSLPAAVIAGEISFLISSSDDIRLRYFKAAAVILGFMSHLLLDEFYSVEWKGGGIRLKKSFGTAVKLWGDSMWANFSTYGKLVVLSYLVLHDPIWMQQFQAPVDGIQPPVMAERPRMDLRELAESVGSKLQSQVDRVQSRVEEMLPNGLPGGNNSSRFGATPHYSSPPAYGQAPIAPASGATVSAYGAAPSNYGETSSGYAAPPRSSFGASVPPTYSANGQNSFGATAPPNYGSSAPSGFGATPPSFSADQYRRPYEARPIENFAPANGFRPSAEIRR